MTREAPAAARGALASLRTGGLVWRAIAYYGSVYGPEIVLRTLPPLVGAAFWALLARQRGGVRANLRRICGARPALRERSDEIATFVAFARSLAEGFATLGPRARDVQLDVDDPGVFAHVRDAGRGVVFVTAHTSGLETAGAGLRRALGLDVMMAMRPEADAAARAISDAARTQGGLKVVHVGDDPLAALPLAAHIRAGGAVGIHIDRLPQGMRGLPVTLFGEQVQLPVGPFLLARATGAPLVAVFTRRVGFLKIRVRAEGPIEIDKRASNDEMAVAAQRVADALTAWVREAPTEWLDWGNTTLGHAGPACRGVASEAKGAAMKLVTYHRDQRLCAGVISSDMIIDLEQGFAFVEREAGARSDAPTLQAGYGRGVLGFIENASRARPAAEALLERAKAGSLPSEMLTSLATATLAAPLPRPPSMRDGYAFRQHVATARKNRGLEMIPEFDQFPVFYFTNHQAVVGPGPLAVQPMQCERLDYELEVAIVVGKEGRNIAAEVADPFIFGYTIMNDWSARAVQMEEMKLSLGPAKGKDFATGLGPYLVTADEIADRARVTPRGLSHDLFMRAWVNGALLSQGNLADMTWTFAQLLERISDGVTIYPGDVIGSGTVGTGCLLELNGSGITKNQWLQPGDHVALEVDLLGRLENTIVAAPYAQQ